MQPIRKEDPPVIVAGTAAADKVGVAAAAAGKKPEELQAEIERLQAENQKKALELKETQDQLQQITEVKELLTAASKKPATDPELIALKSEIDRDFGEGASDRMMTLITKSQNKALDEIKGLIIGVKTELGKRLTLQEKPELKDLQTEIDQVEKDLASGKLQNEDILILLAQARKMPETVKKSVDAALKAKDDKDKGIGVVDQSGSLQPSMNEQTRKTLVERIKKETREAPVGSQIFKPK